MHKKYYIYFMTQFQWARKWEPLEYCARQGAITWADFATLKRKLWWRSKKRIRAISATYWANYAMKVEVIL